MIRRSVSLVACAVASAAALGSGVFTPATAVNTATRPNPLGLHRVAVAPLAASAVAAVTSQAPGAARYTSAQKLTATDALADNTGRTHVRLERSFRGLPVIGGDLVVHQDKSGKEQGVDQTLTAPINLSTTPSVTAGQASAAARSVAKSTQRGASLSKPTLAVDATSGTSRLVWDVRSAGQQLDGTPSAKHIYVDAQSGKVVGSVETIETDGVGNSLYAGQVSIGTTFSGGKYQLVDAARGGSATGDANNKTDSCLFLTLFCTTAASPTLTDADNVWGNGTNADRASAGVDAAYGSQMTWNYYQSTFGRNGIFGTGKGAPNRVHYGSNYVNAFWDGSKMTYGDGDGTNYGPLVSLDVAGHEMSHGVTENTAKLTYSGESGGLNEATSDIFGTMVEFYANNAKQPGNYLIGEAFDLKKHTGLRRMDNPASDGKSLNCWSSSAGNVDVHYSSGIGNHFFYLLAEGSGSKTIGTVSYNSPTCNASNVTGIGRDAAAAIWYRALTVYMTSSTKYAGARTATLKAATDLYGASSAQYAGVAKAWSAVGVN